MNGDRCDNVRLNAKLQKHKGKTLVFSTSLSCKLGLGFDTDFKIDSNCDSLMI